MFTSTLVKGSFVTSFCIIAAYACSGGMETGGLPPAAPSSGVSVTATSTALANAATAVAGNANIAANICNNANAVVGQALGDLNDPAMQVALNLGNPNNPNCTKAEGAINTDAQNLETAAQNDNDAALEADINKLEADIESLVKACLPPDIDANP